MTSYIQFPRYAINFVPNQNFIHIISDFYRENKSLKNQFESKIQHQLYIQIKSPFYIENIENEKNLILSISSIKNEIEIPTDLSFKQLEYNLKDHNGAFIVELKKNLNFEFFINQIVRRFDEFRKVLSPSDYQKDITQFGELTERQIINYQIWGDPYLFQDSQYYISVLTFDDIQKNNQMYLTENLKKLFQNVDCIDFEKISLFKQSAENDNFQEIHSILI